MGDPEPWHWGNCANGHPVCPPLRCEIIGVIKDLDGPRLAAAQGADILLRESEPSDTTDLNGKRSILALDGVSGYIWVSCLSIACPIVSRLWIMVSYRVEDQQSSSASCCENVTEKEVYFRDFSSSNQAALRLQGEMKELFA